MTAISTKSFFLLFREMQQIERRESTNLQRSNLALPSFTDSEGFKLPNAQVTSSVVALMHIYSDQVDPIN
jgi:hypothetical protein